MRATSRVLMLAVFGCALANAITLSPGSLPDGAVGSPYSQTISCNCDSGNWSYTGQLPPGLSLGPATGLSTTISGTPTAGGAYSFTVNYVSGETTGSQSYSVTVLAISPPSLPNAAVNAPYSQTFSVNGVSGYTFVSEIAVPGLSLSPNGVLSGTPTMTGAYTIYVTAEPPVGAVALPAISAAYPLNVVVGLMFTNSVNLPNGVAGMNYSTQLAADGGTPPYTFTVSSSAIAPNALPPGLTLNGNGLLIGVPTTAGDYGFNLDVTDSNGVQASTFFQMIVAAPFSISSASPLPTGTLQIAYSQMITASGGNPPYKFAVTTGTLPTGISLQSNGAFTGTPTATGTFSFTVQATDNFGYQVSKALQVSIAPAGPLLQATPAQLTFTAAAGGANPPTQTIAIVAPSNDPVNYAAQILPVNGAAPAWLTISSNAGAAPAGLTVSVSPGTMPAANYQATIQITAPNNNGQAPINVAVSFTITTTAPTAAVSPASLHFLARAASPGTQEQVVNLANLSSPTVTVVGGSSWISTTLKNPAVRVDVNSQGLGAGSYHDIVRISGTNGSVDVPVSLFVQSAGPSMALSVTGLRFEARQGAGSLMPQAVNVLNLGDPGSTVNWTVTLISGADWLTVNPSSGTATAAAPGKFTLTPVTTTTNLPAGPRYALVSVADANSQDSPQYLTAVFDNEPATTPALPDPSPAGLFFTSSIGSQTIALYTSSTSAVGYGVSTSTTSGGNWLSATPPSGASSTMTPAQLSVTANPAGLAPGIYYGSVNIEMDAAMRTVGVTFVVLPPSTSGSAVHADAACSANQLAITQTGLAGNFSVPAGWPSTLIVQLNDNCGNPVANGSVVASFSSGDPPLSLRGDGVSNTYTATWQPLATSPETTVTLQAAAGTLQATQQFTGAVNQNATPPPSLVPNGTLDIFFNVAAANATGYALAPGTVIQVYGSGFAPSLVAPPNVPLMNQISGTFMLIGSTQIPLFFVSSSVLAAQVPFELTPNQQYQAILSANGALTLPETLDVVSMQPGVLFSISDGTVVAQRLDGSLVSAASPAHPNDNLTLYLTGLGATNPPVASGAATPLQLVPAVTQPTVTLDGQNVPVGYAGLTPTGIGLDQINITVPANARSGNLALVITQNGVAANAVVLPVSN